AQGKLDQALPWFSQAVAADPSLVPARLTLADALFQLHRWPQAAEQYGAAAKLGPDVADAHFGLALSLAQMNELEKAEQAARRAAQLAPDRPDIRDALTWLQQMRAAPKPQRP